MPSHLALAEAIREVLLKGAEAPRRQVLALPGGSFLARPWPWASWLGWSPPSSGSSTGGGRLACPRGPGAEGWRRLRPCA
ncbi:hypothetical protein [Thermus thermophilus]|uniref:hypothetical protein n=1 Tax=Thermus thermophilus TaxID=274 RepID=UPI0002EF5D51|nr:hypothetical protein [Thermus thermophilus]